MKMISEQHPDEEVKSKQRAKAHGSPLERGGDRDLTFSLVFFFTLTKQFLQQLVRALKTRRVSDTAAFSSNFLWYLHKGMFLSLGLQRLQQSKNIAFIAKLQKRLQSNMAFGETANGMNGTNASSLKHGEDIVIVRNPMHIQTRYSEILTTFQLERTPTFLLENQGAGIVAGGDTIDFFNRYDRSGKPVAVPSYKRLYLNKQGDVIHEENYDRVDSDYLQGGKLPVQRPTDGRVNYRYGCTVTDIIEQGERVLVKFTRQDDSGHQVEDQLTTKLLIAADGPSSTIRSFLEPEIKRTYAGYVVIRGTVPETEASESSLSVFKERFCFFHAPGTQNLTYTIAGENGSTEAGKRLLNFVWYANFPEGSPELEKTHDGQRRSS
ncbi:hypothetical protein MRB53_041072 [Persea americana]|nr:hypothetical protein MRB53_041072 [Persea americana]